jgi:hypothetical protein
LSRDTSSPQGIYVAPHILGQNAAGEINFAIQEAVMIRTMVQLTEEQLKALKELAKARKTSVASLVRESVEQYVTTVMRESDLEEKRRRALEFIKYIEEHPDEFRDIEGKTDVARNHDKYLDEIYGTWEKSS